MRLSRLLVLIAVLTCACVSAQASLGEFASAAKSAPRGFFAGPAIASSEIARLSAGRVWGKSLSLGEATSDVAVYAFADELVSQTRYAASGNPSTSFVQADGFGSTRWVTDGAGGVTDAIDYDAFGNEIGRTGTTGLEHLYRGERFDANVGMYDLRARLYGPSNGRFLTQDSFAGFGMDPLSLHHYAFNLNDPVNRIDPSGHFSLGELSAGQVGMSILTRMAVGAVTGAVLGAADAYFAEEDITKGAITGMTTGALLGPLTGIRALKPILGALAIAGGTYGVYDAAVERQDFGLAAFRGITFVGGGAAILLNPSAVRTGATSVYRSIDSKTGNVIYVGITDGFERRAIEHFASKGISISKVPGLERLGRLDARSVEQVLIEFYGLGKNGGTLLNKINSIAQRNSKYAAAIERGRAILRQSGYPGI